MKIRHTICRFFSKAPLIIQRYNLKCTILSWIHIVKAEEPLPLVMLPSWGFFLSFHQRLSCVFLTQRQDLETTLPGPNGFILHAVYTVFRRLLNKQEQERRRQMLAVWEAWKRSININAETTTKFLCACNPGGYAPSIKVETLDVLPPSSWLVQQS